MRHILYTTDKPYNASCDSYLQLTCSELGLQKGWKKRGIMFKTGEVHAYVQMVLLYQVHGVSSCVRVMFTVWKRVKQHMYM